MLTLLALNVAVAIFLIQRMIGDARQLAEMLDGKISVKSEEPGKSRAFTFTLAASQASPRVCTWELT